MLNMYVIIKVFQELGALKHNHPAIPLIAEKKDIQCATGNPVPVDPVDFFRSGSGPVPAKYRPDRPDLTSKFGCRI